MRVGGHEQRRVKTAEPHGPRGPRAEELVGAAGLVPAQREPLVRSGEHGRPLRRRRGRRRGRGVRPLVGAGRCGERSLEDVAGAAQEGRELGRPPHIGFEGVAVRARRDGDGDRGRGEGGAVSAAAPLDVAEDVEEGGVVAVAELHLLVHLHGLDRVDLHVPLLQGQRHAHLLDGWLWSLPQLTLVELVPAARQDVQLHELVHGQIHHVAVYGPSTTFTPVRVMGLFHVPNKMVSSPRIF